MIFETAFCFTYYLKSKEFFDTLIYICNNINPLHITVNLTIDMLILPNINNWEFAYVS